MSRIIRIEPADPPAKWFGADIAFPVKSDDTGGRVSVQRSTLSPGSSNPPHCHGCEDEIFYVESGRVIARTPDAEHELGPGDMVYLPRGLTHQLTCADEPATILTILAPGAIERAFMNVVEDPSAKRLRHEMGVYGVEIVGELKHFAHPLAPDPEEPFVVRAHEGDAFAMAGDLYTIKVASERVGRRFCLVHFLVPPGGGPKPHVHTRDEEIFHILDGEASFYADGEAVVGHAGQTVVLPRNIPHAFKNTSKADSAFITIVTPGGFDEMVRECGTPAKHADTPPPPDHAEIERIIAASPRYGVEMRPDIDW